MANSRVLGKLAAVLFLVSGAVALVSLPATASAGMHRAGVLAVAIGALLAGLATWVTPWQRWRRGVMLYTIVPAGLALIAAGNYVDDSLSNRYSYGVFFVVLFTWIGIAHPRWTSARIAPMAALAYIVPLILRGHTAAEMGTVVLTIPVCVLVCESLAWFSSRLARAEEAARKNESRLRLLASNIPAIVWTTDCDSVITSSAGAGLSAYGLEQDELCGTNFFAAAGSADPDYPPVAAHLRALAGDGAWIEVEHSGRPYRTRIEPLRNGGGRVVGTIGFSLDITDEKQAQEALREAYEREREAGERLRAVNRMKTSFLEAVSHELRTPLSVLLGSSLTLERREADMPEDIRVRLLAGMASNARKLERLLLDLLDLDRLSRGILEPRRQTVDVADIVQRTVDEVAPEGRSVEVDVRKSIAAVDPAKVERLVENLVVNAVKHTDADARVWVRVRPDTDGVLITVEDDGEGVSDELKKSIFEPFRRAGSDSHAPGTGIGLSLVERFAELHGGRAWVEDRSGGGASFRVFLPSANNGLQIASRSVPR